MSNNSNKTESIFFSDVQDENFQVSEISPNSKDRDIDIYFKKDADCQAKAAKMSGQQNNQDSRTRRCNNQSQLTQDKISIIPISSIQDEYMKVQTQDYQLHHPQISGTKAKKIRTSDQNLCKRYHTVANRVLRKMGLFNHILTHFKQIHKRNYFIFVLIICEKSGRLPEFIKRYEMEVKDLVCKFQPKKRLSNSNQEASMKKQVFVSALNTSLQAVYLFNLGNVEESLRVLFDEKKIKRKERINDSYKEIINFEKNFKSLKSL